MMALKSQREECTLLRRKVNDSITRIKTCEESKKQKEARLQELCSAISEREMELEKLITDVNGKRTELDQIKVRLKSQEESLEALSGESKLAQERNRNYVEQKEELEQKMKLLENEVTRLKW